MASDPLRTLTLVPIETALRNTAHLMDTARAHASAKEIGLDAFLQARLYPDMFTLLQQLQYVSFVAADFARHLSDSPPPRVGYDETTWEELRKSLDVALEYVAGIPGERVAARAGAVVPLFFNDAAGMPLLDYAARVTIPDLHFHVVIAYAILRHNGVPLGKGDFLGELQTVAMAPGGS